MGLSQLQDFPNRTSKFMLDNPFFNKVRLFAHQVGMEEWARRLPADPRPIGIKWWVYVLQTKAKQDRSVWDIIPDYVTAARRINELANPDLFSPPNWLHLNPKYEDGDPDNLGAKRFQSSYVPNEAVYPHFAEAVRQARAFR